MATPNYGFEKRQKELAKKKKKEDKLRQRAERKSTEGNPSEDGGDTYDQGTPPEAQPESAQ